MEVGNHTRDDVVAVVYACPDEAALRESLKKGVFEWPRATFHHARHIKAGFPLFVLVQETRRLWGIYKATQDAQIDTSGPPSEHCARVTFTDGHPCHPLSEDVYKPLISDKSGATNHLLNQQQRAALWTSFRLVKPAPVPKLRPVQTPPPPPPPPPPVHPPRHSAPVTPQFYEDGHGQSQMPTHPYGNERPHHHVPTSDSAIHFGGYPPPPPNHHHRDLTSCGGPMHPARHAPPLPPPAANGVLPPIDGAAVYGHYPPPPAPYPGHEFVWDGRGWIPYTVWQRGHWDNNYWSRGETSHPPPPRLSDARNGQPHAGSDSGLSGSIHRQGSNASDSGEKPKPPQQCNAQEEKTKLREQNEALREKVELLETSLSELQSLDEKNRERLDIMEKEKRRAERELGDADVLEAKLRNEVDLLRSSFAGMKVGDVDSPETNTPLLNLASIPRHQAQASQIQSMMTTPQQSPREVYSQVNHPTPQSPQPWMCSQSNHSPQALSLQPQAAMHQPSNSTSTALQGCGTLNRVCNHAQGHVASNIGTSSRNYDAKSMRPQSSLTPRSAAGNNWGNQHAQGRMLPESTNQEFHSVPSQGSPYPPPSGSPSPHIPPPFGSCTNSQGQSNGTCIQSQHVAPQHQAQSPRALEQQGPGANNIVFGTHSTPPTMGPTAQVPMQGIRPESTATPVDEMLPTPSYGNGSLPMAHFGAHAGPANAPQTIQDALPVPQTGSPVQQIIPPVHCAVPPSSQLPAPQQGNAVPRQQPGMFEGQQQAPLSPKTLPQPNHQPDWNYTAQRNWGQSTSVARPPPSQCGSSTPQEIHTIGSCPSINENIGHQSMDEAGQDMYIIGGMIHGEDMCTVEKYNCNGMWEVKGELPSGLSPWGGDACSLESYIVVLGLEWQEQSQSNGAVHRFNTHSGGWDQVAALKYPRKNLSCTSIMGKAVALGGHKPGFQEATNIVEIYDPGCDTWIMGPTMNQARFGFDAVCVSSCVFAIGGQQDKNTPLDTVELWDMRQKGWQTVKSMEFKRGYLSCAARGELIFALGGCGLKHNFVNMERRLEMQATVETFDPRANKWTTNAPMSDTRAFGSAEYWGGYIWAIGGRKSIDDISNMLAMERFDIREGKWKSGHLAGSRHKRAFHTTCIVSRS